jgi:hypothetical protein
MRPLTRRSPRLWDRSTRAQRLLEFKLARRQANTDSDQRPAASTAYRAVNAARFSSSRGLQARGEPGPCRAVARAARLRTGLT